MVNDTIFGSDFRDVVATGDGYDTFHGLGGDDDFYGGTEGDVFFGGDGRDLVGYDDLPTAVTVDLFANTAWDGEGALDLFESVEDVTGSAFDDLLLGDDFHNWVAGGFGHDTLAGSGGDDLLLGEAGIDTLDGGTGFDVLFGGADQDVLAGGPGPDGFVFSFGDGAGTDHITDFEAGLDLVDLADVSVIDGLGTSAVLLDNGTTVVAENGHAWEEADFF